MTIPGNLVEIIVFPCSENIQVKMDETHSKWRLIDQCWQGPILLPIIYNLYTSDLSIAESTKMTMYAEIEMKFTKIRFHQIFD
jgi:hypothetical protein